MPHSASIPGRVAQYETPDWAPLRQFLPLELCGRFMWMIEIALVDGRTVHAYKHADTRQYLHLSTDGAAFLYVATAQNAPDGAYTPISREAAIREAFEGWEELIWPPERRPAVKAALEEAYRCA